MKTARSSLLIFVSLLSLLLLSACSSATPTPAASPTPQNNGKIAVILPGVTSDAAWNSLGFEGVIRLRRETGATVDFAENVSPDKEASVLRDFATKGYGLILTHGVQFGESVKKIAPEFPNTWFVQINGFNSGSNIASVAFKYEEAAYLGGVAAAIASKSDTFGVILGPKYPSELALAAGYTQGVKSVKPNADVQVVHLKAWEDTDAGVTTANQMFDKGVEIVFHDLEVVDQKMLKVAQTRSKQLVNLLFYDINYLSPDPNLVNILFSVSSPFSSIAKQWKENKLEGKVYPVGIKEQALIMSPFRGKLSKEQQDQFEKVRSEILAGNLKITLPSN